MNTGNTLLPEKAILPAPRAAVVRLRTTTTLTVPMVPSMPLGRQRVQNPMDMNGYCITAMATTTATAAVAMVAVATTTTMGVTRSETRSRIGTLVIQDWNWFEKNMEYWFDLEGRMHNRIYCIPLRQNPGFRLNIGLVPS